MPCICGFMKTFLYIFGTKLSRDNEKSHIFDEQMSKCRCLRLGKRWGLHLLLEGGPYLHIQFMKFSRHQIFQDLDFQDAHLFSRHSPFFKRFSQRSPFSQHWKFHDVLRLKIMIFFQGAVSQHFHRFMKFHDIFTTFSWWLPPVVS